MEKGIIIVRPTKKGFAGEVKLENGKAMPVPPGFVVTMELNNKECELVRNKGQIMDVMVNGKTLKKTGSGIQAPRKQWPPKGNPNRNHANQPRGNISRPLQTSKAWAPYNFVPLNDCVVKAQDIPTFDMYHEKDRFTGYIDLELEAITPIYIRGIPENAKEEEKNPEFFAPGGQIRIPGSSIRGMVRNLVEITSWSKFHFYDDRRLYYRAVGDKSELGQAYRRMLADPNDNYKPIVKAGIMKKTSDGVEIYPSGEYSEEKIQVFKINFDKDTRKVDGTDLILDEFQFTEIYFQPVMTSLHPHFRLNHSNQRVPYKLRYAKVQKISETPVEGYQKGYLISSGGFEKKKHFHWIIRDKENASPIYIRKDSDVFIDYANDENRDERADVLKKLETHSEAPCFYVTDKNDEIFAFGHTGMFRMPYKLKISDHIPDKLRDKNFSDFTDVIFGKEAEFAGRVFFEDAVLVPGQDNIYMDKVSPKILSGPKPTTFQHYLKQTSSVLKHWDSTEVIRGNKMYWHKNINDIELDDKLSWQEKEINTDNQHTLISPVRVQLKFVGRIRFENLSAEELGALLFVLDLPENHYHKIGMGKPLGLGSVKITPKLIITSRLERYSKLFSGNGWALAEKPEDIDVFITKFEQYIITHLRQSNSDELRDANSLWDTKRLRQLKCMLDWQNTGKPNWLEKTRYMEIEKKEYKNRPVLPDPETVVKI